MVTCCYLVRRVMVLSVFINRDKNKEYYFSHELNQILLFFIVLETENEGQEMPLENHKRNKKKKLYILTIITKYLVLLR